MKRRDFMKGAAAGALLPAFLQGYSVRAFGSTPWINALTNSLIETDHILVIVQMSGGNDGLNMVIPVDQYGALSAARANILIPEDKVLKLNGFDATGLNPAMTGMQAMFNEGKLQIVQAVSYPQPNFSHFRATDIWMTATNSDEVALSGWVGRYLNAEYRNYPVGYPNATMPHPLAIQIGPYIATLFDGPVAVMGVTINSPNDLYNFANGTVEPTPPGNMGAELAYARSVAAQSREYGDVVKKAYNAGANKEVYPEKNPLGDQLKSVAKLISGGLKTRVYMVSIGSFDTHSNQVDAADHTKGTQARLLGQLSDAVKAFTDDLEKLGLEKRVVGMTFSEFGRRIKSNASGGTDHGAAAPLFVFGALTQGGILGKNPDIPVNADVNSNVPMQHDFRTVYASVLRNWFGVGETELNTTLLRNFEPLPIIKTRERAGLTSDKNATAGVNLISNTPNPFTSTTTIEYKTAGGEVIVQIYDAENKLIATPVDGDFEAGKYKVQFDGSGLPAGTYYAKLQNGSVEQSRSLIKK